MVSRYDVNAAAARTAGPAILLVPPMMLAAEVYDVSPATSAVTILRERGADPVVAWIGPHVCGACYEVCPVKIDIPNVLVHLRGRVVGVYMTAFIGSGALGGPVVGFLDEHFGPRVGLLVAGVVPALVTLAVARHLARRGSVRLGMTRMTVHVPRPTLVPRGH